MDILKAQVEALLTKACPSFETSEYFCLWKKGQESEQYYLLASAFVRHLTHLNSIKKYDEFPEIFALIEELHLRGDEFVNQWATVGILEDLQNRNLHPAGSTPEDFVRFLGPISRWWWEEVNQFWSAQMPQPIGSSGRPHPAEMGNSGRAIVKKASD